MSNKPMGTFAAIGTVAKREINERLRAKSFYILTGLLIAIILGIGVVNKFTSDDGPETAKIGVAGSDAAELSNAIAPFAAALNIEAEVSPFPTDGIARAALDSGDVDAVVLTDERQMLFAGAAFSDTQAVVQQAWAALQTQQSLLASGLTEQQIAQSLTPAPLEVVSLDEDTREEGIAIAVGLGVAVLLFLSLQTFGSYVLMGVVEEKSTAVVEVLLARVRSDQLLAGKIIGIGTVALIQFALAVIAGGVSLLISGMDLPNGIWSAVPMSLAWFLGGYALYSTLFALAGSLVSRQEDAQAASAPIMTALLAAYFLVVTFGLQPESTASRIMSILPPIAPLLMPMRMAAGAASLLEIVTALVLLALSIFLAWKLTGRIYEQVLLQRGTRITWRKALTLARR